MRLIPQCLLPVFGILLYSLQSVRCSEDDPPAQWMSGKFGIGFRIMAGDYIERRETDPNPDNNWGLDWSLLVEQYTSVGASHVIVNLSEGAYGTTWMAYHPVLYDINTKPDTECVPYIGSPAGWDGNCQTAPTPSNNTDYFKEMIDAFHGESIKVIVYVASQGPAMFKAGSNFAFDVFRRQSGSPIRENCISFPANVGPEACFSNPDNCCSPSIGNWIKYVKELPGNNGMIDYPKLHKAYAEVIIAYYAENFKNDIDGWWFDHASEKESCGPTTTCSKDFIDKSAVKSAIRAFQPNVPIAFNTCSNAQKSPLRICAELFEDFTAGHPKPLKGGNPTLPFSTDNFPMVTSIEGTNGGFFETTGGWKSLGHVFMPTGTIWNGPTLTNVWTTPYPYTDDLYSYTNYSWSALITEREHWNTNSSDWFNRALAAGGSWTWNVPRQSNDKGSYFLLHPNHLAMVAYAAAQNTTTSSPSSSEDEPSTLPSNRPSLLAPSNVPSISPSISIKPTPACVQSKSDVFFMKKKMGGKVVIVATCGWLRKLRKIDRKRVRGICSRSKSFGQFKAARELCKRTCKSCDDSPGPTMSTTPSIAPAGACQDEEYFVKKVRKNGLATIRKCQWLQELSDAGKKSKLCSRNFDFSGGKSASEACAVTCSSKCS